ncbi:hypothetical protein ACF0H5_022560 [Mactra antiquata]
MATNSIGLFDNVSADVRAIRCGPCLTEGNSIDAYHICENCCEYLCATCVRYHRKFTATAKHVIVKKSPFLESNLLENYLETNDGFSSFNDDQHSSSADRPTESKQNTHLSSSGVHQTTRDNIEKYSMLIVAHCGDLNVKTEDDSRNCFITGCTLLTSGYLVITDHENRSVKIVDTKHSAILSELFLEDAPWDVTMVSSHRLAVTLPKARLIQYMIVEFGVLYEDQHVMLNGECRGIAHHDGHLVVSYDKPSMVQILSLDGHVLKSFDQNQNGVDLFRCPQYVAIGPDGRSIYVSDRDTFKITKITFEGKILATYVDHELCSPRGICAKGDGTLIICNWRNNKLHLISSACEKVKILQPLSDDVLCPTTVCFCDDLNKLYVSRHWVGAHPNYVNNMKVFEFE